MQVLARPIDNIHCILLDASNGFYGDANGFYGDAIMI